MASKFRSIIVDDEKLAREDLKSLLSKFEEIDLVGEAKNSTEAFDICNKLNPDLIFLDIQMPGGTGFDLLEKLEVNAKIIFVTAYNQYAIKAFDVDAYDYLMKPVNPERLGQTINKLKLPIKNKAENLRGYKIDDVAFLLINSHYKFLPIKEIKLISASAEYSEIFTNESSGLVQKSMKEWELRLPENHFCRIHRSTIVNLSYIEKIEDWFNYSFRVYIKGISEPYTMSRRFAAKIKEKFK